MDGPASEPGDPAALTLPAKSDSTSKRIQRKRALPVRSSPVSTERSLRSTLETLHAAREVAPAPAGRSKKTAPFARKPVLQELEARLLLSADLNPAAQDTLLATPALQGAEFRALGETTAPAVVTSAQVAPIQRSNELVFVDTQTPEYEALVESMRAAALSEGVKLEFVLIDADKDGIRKITDTLAQKTDLDAIHIVSHASDGAVQLGSTQLDFETLLKRAASIKKWGEALTENGDILFYGCDLAASAGGQSLIQAVARLTRADVAASEDPTGAAAKGGDWELEFKTGAIETQVAVSTVAQAQWDGLLVRDVSVGAGGTTTEAGGTHTISVVLTGLAGEAPTSNVLIPISVTDATEGTVSTTTLTFTPGNWNVAQTVTITGRDDSQTDGDVGYTFVTGALSSTDLAWNGINPADRAMTNADNDRVQSNVVALYTFEENGGATINDVAGTNLALTLNDTGNVTWSPGALTVNTNSTVDPTIAQSAAGTNEVYTRIVAAQQFTVEAWVENAAGLQQEPSPPHRLVSLSADATNRNFSLLMTDADESGGSLGNASAYNARVRGGAADLNGSNNIVAAPANSATSALQHVVFTADTAGNRTLYVDGVSQGTVNVGAVNFASWANNYQLALLNELTLDRGWIGTMHLAAVYDRALTAAEVQRNFSAGADIHTLVVDTTSDVSDGDVSSIEALLNDRGADGFISLREAILATNATANAGTADQILFNIAGAGVHTINVGAALPTVTDAVIIDATSEPDFAGTPMVRLDGTSAGFARGLQINAGGSTIRGLQIVNFGDDGIYLQGGSGNVVAGNYVGTNGTADFGNGEDGIVIDGSSNNTIGGTAAADRNVISGNNLSAIYAWNAAAGNVIRGNYIGTNAAGTAAIGNGDEGIYLDSGVSGTTIGGTAAGAGNVISGAQGGDGDGIQISGASNTLIQGNYIGTNAAGTASLGNNDDGIDVDSAATNVTIGGTAAGAGNLISGNVGGDSNGIRIDEAIGVVIQGNKIGTDVTGTLSLGNALAGIVSDYWGTGLTIGGTAAGAGNAIAFNGTAGIQLNDGQDTTILGNSIHSNGGLGIDFQGDGVTANDAGDLDAGTPNDLQNFPTATAFSWDGANFGVTNLDIDSAAGNYRIEFFASPTNDGEGRRYLGSYVLSAAMTVSGTIAGIGAVNPGEYITMTATRQTAGPVYTDTSEFSAPVLANVTGGNVAPVATDDAYTVTHDTTLATAAGWWNAAWGYRRTIEIDNPTSSALTDFPLRIRLDATFDYARAKADGSDLRFVDADGVTVLTHQIESWNPGGDSYIWVKVPNVAVGADSITMYYGNAAAAAPGSGTAVWSNGYRAVYQFGSDPGAAGPVPDLAGNGLDGVNVSAAFTTAGTVNGGALDFNAALNPTSDYVDLGPGNYINGVSSATFAAWIRPDALPVSQHVVGVSHGTDSGSSRFAIELAGDEVRVIFKPTDAGIGGNVTTTGANLVAGNWYHVAAIVNYTAGSVTVHVNGGAAAGGYTQTFTGIALLNTVTSGTDSAGATLGVNETGSGIPYDGLMDGVTISTVARTADELRAHYLNVTDNAAGGFVDIGAAEQRGVLANDTDPDGNPLTVSAVNGVPGNVGNPTATTQGGTVTLNADGSFTYTPPAGFSGVDTFTYTASDGAGGTDTATVTITVAGNVAPQDLTATNTVNGGLSINTGGGNDAYLAADEGAGLLGGSSALTFEIRFNSPSIADGEYPTFVSYATPTANDGIWFGAFKSGATEQIGLSLNGSWAPVNYDVDTLFDGNDHSVAFTWTQASGAWAIYVDGVQVGSGTGIATGQTISTGGSLVLAHDQDAGQGTYYFEPGNALKGTLYDIRFFDDVRTPAEIAANYNTAVALGDNLIANWRLNDISTSDVLPDAVSGNDLTVQRVTQAGFTASAAVLTLRVNEAAPNGTAVGTITATDDVATGLTYSLLDDAGGRFTINSATGQVTVANGSLLDYETTPSHSITVRVTDGGGLTYDEAFTVAVLDQPDSHSISGTIVHDIDGDADVAEEAPGARFSGATVHLFADNATVGAIEAGDGWVATTTTDASGNYSFTGLADGNYWVVVDSTTLNSGASYNGPYDASWIWAEQTYGDNWTTGGAVDLGARYGGRDANTSDASVAASPVGSEHVARINVSGANVTGVDYGFSFNAIVTTDDGDDHASNRTVQGSLRQFILNANAITNAPFGVQSSNFSIGSGAATIAVGSLLPSITDTVVIDGTTQEGWTAAPVVQITGPGLGTDGLYLAAGSDASTIRGLIVNNFDRAIALYSAGNLVVGNYLGTNAAGTAAAPNVAGVWMNSDNNTIGGTSAAERNILSGNVLDGVQINGSLGASGNVVIGNYVGLDVTGTLDVGNTNQGVALYLGATNNTIGGAGAGEGNVISGNNGEGVRLIHAGTSGNLVLGNLIGTNAAGTARIANDIGVAVWSGAGGNTIGGIAAGTGNVISGNDDVGIYIDGGNGNIVLGNIIGLDRNGNLALGNGAEGVAITNGSTLNTIGGTSAGARNVISGNGALGGDAGISLWAGANNNAILGNYIGLDLAGTVARPNASAGINVDGVSGTTIGGTAAGAGNVVSGNAYAGILLQNGATGTLIRGNYVGTDATGTVDRGNAGSGVHIRLSATGNTIGGTAAGAGNLISGNNEYGIFLEGATAGGNTIQQNLIGTRWDGTGSLGNAYQGIGIAGSPNNLIGGQLEVDPTAGNTIANNGFDGVAVTGATATGNRILGNIFYANGDLAIDVVDDGPNVPQDGDDSDTGPNNLQNFPVLWNAVSSGGNTTITGELRSTAGGTFRIEFFATPVADTDPTGYGEARSYLGSATLTDGDADGVVSINVTLPGALAAGTRVTATATNTATNDTSEFAQNVIATAGSTISGTIVHDIDGDADVAEEAPGARFSGATVHLFADNATVGAIEAGDGWVATTTTDASGNYSFTGLADGNYWVVVDSTTLNSGASYNGPYDASWIWAEQTYGDNWTTGGAVDLGARYGGRDANTSDASVAASPVGSEHVARINVSGANVTGVDYGFSFNAIVTTDDGDDHASNRTVQGSLRQFVLNSNAIDNTSPYGIQSANFSIGGGGVQTIAPAAAFANVTDAVALDATTQEGYAGTPLIQIDGALAGLGADGFFLGASSSGSTIRGFAIYNFDNDAVHVRSDNNQIRENHLGTDAGGLVDLGNGGDGVHIGTSGTPATGNLVRGNVIIGNASDGVVIAGAGTTGNLVQGNRIGVDVGNGLDGNRSGVRIQDGATGNTIGGTVAGDGNVIGGNLQDGVRIVGDSDDNRVLGNWIGTDSGGADLGNVRHGVWVEGGPLATSSPTQIRIGGIGAGEPNTIAFNDGDGVLVSGVGTAYVLITANSIHSNGELGIDLAGGTEGASGWTANDAVGTWVGANHDPDTGPNKLQNYPSLSGAVWDGATLWLSGLLESTDVVTSYRIHVYANSAADLSGHGEGERYLGAFDIANVTGTALFTNQAIAPLAAVGAGDWITVTATAITGSDPSTSEFSVAMQATAAAPVNAAPAAVTATEDTAFAFTGANQISVADSQGNLASVVLTVANGTLTAAGPGTLAGNGTASLTITGTQADINASLATLVYQGTLHYNGADTLTIVSTDAGALSDTDNVAITVTAVNDAPGAAAPVAYNATEQTLLDLAGTLSIADVDAGAGSLTVTLSVASGVINAAAGGSGAGVANSGTAAVTLTGTLAQISDLLAGNLGATLTYFNGSDTPPASTTLTLSVNDNGNTGAGGAQVAAANSTINIAAVNDAPTATAPASYAATEQVALSLASASLTVFDVDSLGAVETVTLSVVSGTLSATAGTTGVGIAGGGTNTLTLTGTIAELNNLLTGGGGSTLTYVINSDTPPASDTLTISINDGGNSGSGGALTGSANSTISITPINDAPVNTVPAAQTVTENRSVAFSTLNGNAISVADVDAGAADVEVTLSSATGTLLLPDLTGLTITGGANGTGTLTFRASIATINARLDGLIFTETLPGTGAASFTIVTDDLGNTGAPGALSDTDAVTVNVLAAPTIRSSGAIVVDGAVDAAWAAAASQALANQVDVDTPGGPGIASAADASATWSALWDNNYLYVLVTVTDDDIRLGDSFNPWNDDSVEIFVDGDYSWSGAYDGVNDSQYIFRYGSAAAWVSPSSANLDTTGIDVAWSTPAANQYVMELRIPWSKFGGLTLVDGQPLGLDVHVNDDDNEPNVVPDPDHYREGKLAWSQVIDNASSDTRAFGLVRLQDSVPAPVADTYGTNEDTPLSVPAVTGVLANDTGLGDGGITLAVVGVPVGGAVALNDDGSFTFTPTANFNGAASLVYRITDADGDTATATVTVNVTSVNDAPAGTDGAVSVNEDATYTFLATDFGFTDPNDAPGNAFLAVRIASLPLAGSLFHTVNGAVGVGTVVSVADINAGLLRYTPPADANGAGYASFTFQVQDDGGVLNAGIDLDPTPNTLTLNVNPINDAPVNTVPGAGAAFEDVATAVTGISIADVDAGAGSMLMTLSVPSGTLAAASGAGVVVGGSGSGTLTLTGTVGSINAFIAASNVTFTTASNAAANVLLTVTTDDQGNIPAPAQSDTDAFTIVVTAVNDAPAGTDGAVSVNEDATYTFLATDFGFTDPNDAPGNAFLAVRIASLPLAGSLFHTVNGAVGVGTVVSVADINAGLLRYTPPADANGAGYASFTFQVQDDGGVLNAGIDLDPTPNTLTLNVNPINDAPVNTVPGVQATPEDTALVFSAGNGNLVAIADVDAGAGLVDVTLTVTNGTLTLAGTAGLAFMAGADGTATMTVRGTIADINAALEGMSYVPTLNYTGPATLTILTDDRGNAGAGGALTDSDVVNITVAAANDAPVNTVPAAQATNEDTALVFSAGNGNLVSIADLDAGLANVQVQLTVTNGTLTLAGVGGLAFVAGADGTATMTVQGTIAAINAAMDGMTYAPAANYNGPATLTITTDDLGNAGAGGALIDTDVVSLTVNAVNDAPVNVVPGAQTGNEDVPLALGGVSVSDVDGGPVRVTLTVANGRLDVGLAGGATITAGANGSATLTLDGTQAQVNAALATLAYTGAANWSGGDTLTMTTTDLGNFGAGGPLGDLDTVALAINPVNDAPVLGANAFVILEGGTLVLSSTNLSATDIDDAAVGLVFFVGGVTNGHFGLAANPAAVITSFTQAQVLAGQVVFVHSGDTPSFTITVFDGGASVGPQAANITYLGGGGTPTPPPGSGGGGGTTVTPPELPPVTPATSTPLPLPGEAGFFGGAGRGGGGDDGGSRAVFVQEAAVIVPTQQGVTRTDATGGPEAAAPPVRIQAEGIDTTALRSDIQVEPVRAELQVLPTRGGLDLAEDDPERQQIEIVMNSVRITGMALSVGAIWWAARAAGLVASLLASSPAWRHVDPLPVLGRDDEDEEEEVWDETSAEEQERRDDEHRASWVLEDSKLPS